MQDLYDIVIRIMADGLVVPIVLLGAWVMLWRRRREFWNSVLPGVVTGLIALWLAKLLSIFYQAGNRPFVQLGVDAKAAYLNNPGFPSDHALFVFTITLVVWATTKDKRLSLALLIMSCLVALGRVLALVHTPLDVAGGALCALAAATIVYGRSMYTTKPAKLPR